MDDTTNTNTSTGAPREASNTGLAAPRRRYRPRGESVRDQRITPRFTDAELSEIKAAADAARITLTGFCALATLAVARRRSGEPGEAGEAPAGVEELAALQRELFAARTAVNRTGVNLNQAAAQLNATGQPPVWLEHAVNRVVRTVAELDAVVAQLHRRLA